MAINKNHEFEELDGVKCGVVEKNVQPERANFLKELLIFNGFNVVIIPSPPPKVAPDVETIPLPTTYTVGVTDYTFNAINAIFGRLLKTMRGNVVTQAYWNQKEEDNIDEVPYYQHNA
jgi:hypothetical protein